MVTAVFLLAVTVTLALLCLPPFPSDQVVPIPCSCFPRWALPQAHTVPFWATGSFRVCQLLKQLQLWTEIQYKHI